MVQNVHILPARKDLQFTATVKTRFDRFPLRDQKLCPETFLRLGEFAPSAVKPKAEKKTFLRFLAISLRFSMLT